MSVVDDEQQRLLLAEVHREPEEPVQLGVRDVVRRGWVRGGVEYPGRHARCTGQKLLSALRRGGTDFRLEELAHDTEREVALKRRAGPGHDTQPQLLRPVAQDPQKRRLPLAGGSLEHRQATRAGPRGVQQLAQRRELSVALDQVHRPYLCSTRTTASRNPRRTPTQLWGKDRGPPPMPRQAVRRKLDHMTTTSPHQTPKPQPHFFQTPVVRETPRPTETISIAGTW